MARSLRLVDHDPSWSTRFAVEAARIRDVTRDHVDAVEHIGSTSVPGLDGKPVLDIAIAVQSEANAEACIAPLERLGYSHRGPHGDDPRRRYFVRDVNDERLVQIHLYILPAAAWNEQIVFRDALRASPALRAEYLAEKWRVAEEVQWDKAAYSIAKGDFIQRALATLRTGTGTLTPSAERPPDPPPPPWASCE